jgi:hypothetical protein
MSYWQDAHKRIKNKKGFLAKFGKVSNIIVFLLTFLDAFCH